MEIITQLFKSFKSISDAIFYIQTNLEPLNLLDVVPASLEAKIEDPEFIKAVETARLDLDMLQDFIKPLVRSIKSAVKAQLAKRPDEPMIPYADFKADDPPLILEKLSEPISFSQICENRMAAGLQMIKPVVRRNELEYKGTCPYCEAPNEYIYLNNGRSQLKCKACSHTFTEKTGVTNEVYAACPHCRCKLTLQHERTEYDVYVCPNKKCSYYLSNKEKLDSREFREILTSSRQYRLHYHFRKFKFSLDEIKVKAAKYDDIPDLSRIHFDEEVLGLILCYYVNYGLSCRKTALILKDIHGLRISHQTVMNYARAVSKIIKPMVDRYPYDLSNRQAGDETYVKVRGKNQYVFFCSDTVKKIITSYTIYGNRSTREACETLWNVLSKYPDGLPEDFVFTCDGNPIYNAAQIFYKLQGYDFELRQVIGVKNKDVTSKEWRPQKQIEERLNRTYKQNYHGTNGYDKLDTANFYMVLYVAFFNFLRVHSSLGYKTPVQDNLFNENDLMPSKWIRLINLAQEYITEATA